MTTLTYLAQLRQNPHPQRFKSVWLLILHVFTMRPFLLTKPREKRGTSHKEIVTIGIAPGADWDGQNRNTEEWLTVVECWQIITRFTL